VDLHRERSPNVVSPIVSVNTSGVYHPLSSGFKLKHDRLRGDEDIKVKPMDSCPT
jgi:hypothetical protein